MSIGFLSLLAIAALLGAVNGANDVGKPVATLAGSGVTTYRRALVWGALTTLAGALGSIALARALARTFASGFLVTPASGGGKEASAAALAAAAWVLLATWKGGPVSTTHAIAGGLIGAGIASGGLMMVRWGALGPKVFLPLATSPLAAALLGAGLYPLVRRTSGRWKGTCVCVGVLEGRLATAITFNGTSAYGSNGFPPVVAMAPVAVVGGDPKTCLPARALTLSARPEHLHWLSAGATSFARGLNDAPKIAALALPLLVAGSSGGGEGLRSAAFIAVAAAMVVGSILGGSRVAHVLGERIARIDENEGLSANLATALLVLGASRLGLPVSTTHVATGAITGAGVAEGRGSVSWTVLRNIALAWVVTLPVSALFGAAVMTVLSRIG